MRVWTAPALVAVSCFALSSCSQGSDVPPVTEVVTVTTDQPAPDQPAEQSADQPEKKASNDPHDTFADVLANPGAVPVNPAARYNPKGTYSYTFTDINADGIEDMLLRVDSEEFSPVVALRADGKGGYVASKDVLIDGAASAGGSRAWVHATADGDGIIQEDGMSTGATKNATRYRMEGEALVKGEASTHAYRQEIPNSKKIDWLDTSTAESRFPRMAQSAAPAGDTLSGTIQILTNAELVSTPRALYGVSPDEEHLVFVYDTPQNLAGSKAGDPKHVQESWFAAFEGGAENAFDWEAYVGKHVTIIYDPDSVTHRSGTDMPPGTQIREVYEVKES